MSDEVIRSWQVRIKDERKNVYSYYSNTNSNKQAERAKELEEFNSTFYSVINKVVDLGGMIDPGKYFSENNYFNIRATEKIANEVGKITGVESIRKG